jgi:hypothetical protein
MPVGATQDDGRVGGVAEHGDDQPDPRAFLFVRHDQPLRVSRIFDIPKVANL